MQKINITPGAVVLVGSRKVEIIGTESASEIRVRDKETGQIFLVAPGDIGLQFRSLEGEPDQDSSNCEGAPLIEECRQIDIDLASFRYDVLSPFAGRRGIPKGDIEGLATTLEVSVSQVYRLLDKLDTSIGALSLIPQRRGRPKGTKIIGEKVEEVICETIDEYYNGPGISYQEIFKKVEEKCFFLSLPPPGESTVTQRIKERPKKELLKKTVGAKAARQKLEVRGGKLMLERPLQLVQIDHALVDCIIVGGEQRWPLGRPWATIAIDVFTRAILGIHLSLMHPSSMSVALCISHALLPKDQWLKKIEMEACEYPFYGVPERIHVDNAKEFKSKNLSNSCRRYNIELTYRPKGKAYNGAHIERLIGTFMRKVHLLPGTTMSDIKAKGDYQSEKYSALTLSELRDWFVTEIEIYHKKKHSALGCSPLHQWERHFRQPDGGLVFPPIVEDKRRLLIDFMPMKARVLGRSGIRIHNLDYYSQALGNFDIGTKCSVRFDPESLSKIWVLPEGERHYLEVPYSDLRLPDVSLSEFTLARNKLNLESNRRVAPEEVFKLVKKNEELVQQARVRTKKARKTSERNKIRRTDPSHPLNELTLVASPAATADYSRKPTAYDIEDQ